MVQINLEYGDEFEIKMVTYDSHRFGKLKSSYRILLTPNNEIAYCC